MLRIKKSEFAKFKNKTLYLQALPFHTQKFSQNNKYCDAPNPVPCGSIRLLISEPW